MKESIKGIVKWIKWIWQFPQNVLALCLEGILCNATIRGTKKDDNHLIWCNVLPSNVSLGDYIFIHTYSSMKTIEHECGHSRQSDILGPLYLIVIGIPSVLHNIIHTLCSKVGLKWDYYKFYTEHWLMNKNN